MILHRVKSVQPLKDYILSVSFKDGSQKEYDVKPLFNNYSMFDDLKNIPGLFDQVETDPGGYGISWNDEIDLSADELWENGK